MLRCATTGLPSAEAGVTGGLGCPVGGKQCGKKSEKVLDLLKIDEWLILRRRTGR